MMTLSLISFVIGLCLTVNIVEYMALKKVIPNSTGMVMVTAWTTFAWSQGLFSP